MGWESLIDPLINIGAGLFGSHLNKSSQIDPYVNYLKHQEDLNYQKAVADKQYADQYAAWQAQAQKAARANAAASKSAAMATEKNRQKASKKANKALMAGYDKALNLFDPYVKEGANLLPKMSETYQGGLSGINNILGTFAQPSFQETLFKNPKPMWESNIPIPEFFKKGS